ncbi:hypothetical protein EBU91_04810 [bacterium]|nr:hypothetical protein [bacterium]
MKNPGRIPNKSVAEQRIDAIQRKINEPEYSMQVYPEGSVVTIPGELFQRIIEANFHNNAFLTELRSTLQNLLTGINRAIEGKMAANDLHTTDLAEQHIGFVDKGITVKYEPKEKEEKDGTEGDSVTADK